MARAQNSAPKRNRHRKVIKQAKGYFGHKHVGFKTANEAVTKANQYAYRDRKNRKRNFRRLWITRISAGTKANGMTYSTFINGLNKANIEINRKMLADIALNQPEQFTVLVEEAKAALKN